MKLLLITFSLIYLQCNLKTINGYISVGRILVGKRFESQGLNMASKPTDLEDLQKESKIAELRAKAQMLRFFIFAFF